MREPEEIIRGLELCANSACGKCKEENLYWAAGDCFKEVKKDALDYILYLTSRRGMESPDAISEPEAWTREKILAKAKEVVSGQREQDYGTPEDSFGMISDLWSAYLRTEIAATDVAVMMALLKVARLANSPDHMDSWVDLAGYAACGGEINGKEK